MLANAKFRSFDCTCKTWYSDYSKWLLRALICTKFVFGRGSAPDPIGGAYSASPDPVPDFRDPTSKEDGERKKMNGTHFFRKLLDPPLSKQIDYGVRNDSTRALQAIWGKNLKRFLEQTMMTQTWRYATEKIQHKWNRANFVISLFLWRYSVIDQSVYASVLSSVS